MHEMVQAGTQTPGGIWSFPRVEPRSGSEQAGGNYFRVSAGLRSMEVGGAPEPGVVHQRVLLTAWGREPGHSDG